MRQDIIEYLQKEIKRRCKLPSNFFEMGCFYHIRAVADADAISHFYSVSSILYLVYVERKMIIEEGIVFVREKLERSYCMEPVIWQNYLQ